MNKSLRHLVFVLFFSATAIITGTSYAAPAEQGTNLLQNPSFEQPFGGGTANNWQRWHMLTAKQDESCMIAYHFEPKWNVETGSGFVRDGAASQYVGNNWDTWAGGVYQTVPATPGVTYRFSFYGRGRGTSEASPAPSDTSLQMNMRAGIDPNGSGLWSDSDVVWGSAGSPHDAWQEFSVQATATGNQITVFTSANWGVTGVNQCRQFLDTWYDAAQLVAQTPPTDTPPPQPTQAPATATFPPAPTGGVPTEAAAATVIATMTLAVPTETPTPAGSSAICVNAFLDVNGNGLHDADEGYLAGVTLTVAQGTTIIGQAVSNGSETPICFGNLPAGTYQVGQTLPPALEMTTQANATVNVGEGQTVGLEFGSRMRTTPTAEPQTDPTETAVAGIVTPTIPAVSDGGGSGPSWLVLLGLGAVLVGVVLLGALLYIVLRR